MDLEHKAIERLKVASEMSLTYYEKPLIITTSGGKDSDVCLELADHAGIPYEVEHNHTTADAPQTVRYVRQRFRGLELKGIQCRINYPVYKDRRVSMWSLIPMKLMPPTRLTRYCCDILKEQGGKNRLITTGVRWDESANRKNSRGIYETFTRNKENKIILNNDNDDKRQLFENCKMKAKRICNPIIDWKTSDVWDYLHDCHCKSNPLYQCGFDRVGCIGCPLANRKQRFNEFRIFPPYEVMYRHSYERMLEARALAGKPTTWKTSDDVFRWVMEDKNLDGQIKFDAI